VRENVDPTRAGELGDRASRGRERTDHIAEWVRLTEEKSGASCATKPAPDEVQWAVCAAHNLTMVSEAKSFAAPQSFKSPASRSQAITPQAIRRC
jgi:hypothetical protein